MNDIFINLIFDSFRFFHWTFDDRLGVFRGGPTNLCMVQPEVASFSEHKLHSATLASFLKNILLFFYINRASVGS